MGPTWIRRWPPLTNQERRALSLIGEGMTNRGIAGSMFLAEKTVKNYVSSMLAKLGLQCRTQAAVFAARHLPDLPELPDVTQPGTAASNFTGEMAAELRALVDAGTIRVIDVLILTKGADGSIEALELSDVDELGDLQAIEAELAELLAADDVEHLAAAMDPGSTAGVIVYENVWAAPFASAARRSGGQLIANGRIPIQAIIASIEADQATATVGD